ncbi:MAG: bifunctional aldolase/short-chain dehydrogenase [Gammaproteobacteria bacterium]|nr:bifunctional aldolase/short-chain dehydrogenase [Gammaproteobacteria bacterium]
MRNRWNQQEAARLDDSDTVGQRVYSSRLLGADSDLVLHGGGNTSVKGTLTDVFGETVEVLFIKGSGWDLRTIEASGFPATRLPHLRQLAQLPCLNDTEMMRQLRLALLDPGGPTPSVEAILHALIPHRFVDHSHADAVVTLSNTPEGEQILHELYGDEILILPYLMPGFLLARQVAAATEGADWSRLRGIVLMHHGIFTFHDQAKTSYDTMIELVTRAEDFIKSKGATSLARSSTSLSQSDLRYLSLLRKQAGVCYGGPVLIRCNLSESAAGFATLDNAEALVQRGPLTPDHTIHAKAFAAVFDDDPVSELETFTAEYEHYFRQHAGPEHQRLDAMPRWGIWRRRGLICLAPNNKRLGIVADISRHTIKAIQQAENLGGWTTLSRKSLFEVEYWELEQAKLKSSNPPETMQGKVALVSGAASGIGKACMEALVQQGAVVVALDTSEIDLSPNINDSVLAQQCDVTCSSQIDKALSQAVQHFGGLDLLVSNAGCFPPSALIAELPDDSWEQSVEVNMSAHMRLLRACIPLLQNGFDPAVVIIGSKNVPAPGPGAAAYSVAKAGLNQLARIAALELGGYGIRVNTVHPDAIYDTALWTQELLAERAAHYGMSPAEYRSANLLGAELNSSDVASVVVNLLGPAFSKTTGAQIAIDGGNERVV